MPRVFALLVLTAYAYAQAPLVTSLLEYLDLSGAQITRLRQSAADFNRFYQEKALRYQQVARELTEENAREVLDAQALGLRYIEQEAICRELRAAHQQNFDRNTAILTDLQKARLRALDVVGPQLTLAQSAANQNLLEPVQPVIFGGGLVFIPQFGLDSSLLGATGGICGVPLVSFNPILRTREAKR
jgi:hypothetical protein